MRKAVAFLLVVVVGAGFCAVLAKIPFGEDKVNVANRYMRNGVRETGSANIVTSVVVTYRGFDTLGEVTVLFIAAVAMNRTVTSPSVSKPRYVTTTEVTMFAAPVSLTPFRM